MTTALTLLEILAIVMFGEAGMLNDELAAKAVGHVFMNRLNNGAWGSMPEAVMAGFHSYSGVELGDVPEEYFHWADEMLFERDQTSDALCILSWQDLNNMFGLYGPYVRQYADWKSKQIIGSDGLPYGLFAYKQWPSINCLDDGVRSYTKFLISVFDMPSYTCRQLLQGEWK